MGKRINVVYREIQRPKQVWMWILILLFAVFMWYWFIQQIVLGVPVGDKPAPDAIAIIFWIIFGITFPVVMLGALKLIIEVREEGLYVRFAPFHFKYKQYLFSDIRHYKSITYSPLKRFGGWGFRFSLNGEKAYNLNGNEGIELKLNNDTVVIGTEKPNELKKAMDSAQKA